MRTRASMSTAWRRAETRSMARWRRIPSTICSPMVKAGLSEVIGSWKIIEMRLPRTARMAAGGRRRRSAPSKRLSPATRPGGIATSPMIESAVTLLRHPDSPTRPSVRPASSARLTPSTALKVPASVAKEVVRPRISRRALTPSPASGANPVLHHRHAVHAPERLAVDDEEGRAEEAGGDRAIDLALGAFLQRRIVEGLCEGIGVEADGLCHRDHLRRRRNVAPLHEVRVVERLGERAALRRVAIASPIEGAQRRDGEYGEMRRIGERHLVQPGGAREILLRVLALHRHIDERCLAGELEHRPEEHGPPAQRPADALLEIVGEAARDVAVGRGELEVEVD